VIRHGDDFEPQLFMAWFTALVATPTAYIATVRPLPVPTFFSSLIYDSRKPGVKAKIVEMAFNGSGARDTARVLNIGINTVLRTLKTRTKARNYRKGCVG
jgi:hypothetical protein